MSSDLRIDEQSGGLVQERAPAALSWARTLSANGSVGSNAISCCLLALLNSRGRLDADKATDGDLKRSQRDFAAISFQQDVH